MGEINQNVLDMTLRERSASWREVIFPWEELDGIENEEILDYHSIVNLLNILAMQIDLLNLEFEPLEQSLVVYKQIKEISFKIHNGKEQSDQAIKACLELGEDLQKLTNRLDQSTDEEMRSIALLLGEISDTLYMCSRELYARILHPDTWIQVTPKEIQLQMQSFFSTIAKNSRGKYHFVYDHANRDPNVYRVGFDFKPNEDGVFALPPVLLDTLRDLAANARKYTPPGGDIEITLQIVDGQIILKVEDNGMGIPKEEIAKVVNFGFRASNTNHLPTMGGGFGLTKALSVSFRHQGALKIASAVGEGTRITIEIPVSYKQVRPLISAV